jgi:glycyl-tRNA synthetase
MKKIEKKTTLDQLVSLCKRRGFIFPSSEIYGGLAAVYDYGPYGVELANTIKSYWWKTMVQFRREIVGIDAGIFMHPRVWEASGHVSHFSDPLVECKKCHARFRADHLLSEFGIKADEKMAEEEINKIFSEKKGELKCPQCGSSEFTKVKKFNLLVQSNLGNFTGDFDKEKVFLRGETCQGIYVNYKNILNSTRVKIPFGIAQIGKAFRNEITARQFIFRTREFEQMEMQYFVPPKNELKEFEKLKKLRWDFYLSLGFKKENLRWQEHENLVFYANKAFDIEYKFPFGFDEVEGIHARGDYDLSQHAKYSKTDLSYTDPQSGEKYVPHIIESSAGVGRIMLALLAEAYHEEQVGDESRTVLKFSNKVAPVKLAVFPLLKNRPELVEVAKKIYDNLKFKYSCEFDDHGNIGKRYRRQDEIGTPYCLTVDFESLKDKTVTVRDRDTMQQERIKIDELENYFASHLES